MKKKDYKFSIIIPNYNYGEWIEKCLNSVLNQTYKNYELIFVDDMSEDNSLEIAYNALYKNGKITNAKIIPLEQKRLNGGARNVGILESTGDYVVFLDSDDWLISDTVLEGYNNKLSGEDVMFVGVQRLKNGVNETIWGLENFKDKYEAMASGCSGSCFKVIKTELLKKCLFSEGTLMEDRNHHCLICYKMNTFTHFGKVSHIWNRDNTKSVLATREKNPLWVASIYKNYADCLYLKMLAENDKDYKAVGVLNKRLKLIQNDIDRKQYWQH